ncbi:membrane protein [Vibrio ishigakensis]|uniref:Membrane protein n=1 Tax=Vibrio ishigakensis TaxID=1481914 RepID=A0A0B8PLH1_9VIBR|nr:membrane protein [Vibrio ishigakensis]
MIWGHEVRTLQPCGSENAFWVQLPEAFKQPVSNLTSEPYQPMYAEVFGYLEPTAAGFAEQYPAQFVVTEVNMVTAENPNRCEQPTRPDRAFGNEPFWNATYNEQKVTFTQMSQEAQEFTVKELEQDLTQTRVDYNSGSLTIDKQICRDSMGDSLYGASSSLEVNGKTFKGCSTLSNQADQELYGSYAQTQDDGTTITLTLKPDHISETRYSYADGSNDVTENGYWQSLTNGKIEATNVSYQAKS